MAICLICLKDKENKSKYCRDCSSELDRRHSEIWNKTKSELYSRIVHDMILERATNTTEQNGHVAQQPHGEISPEVKAAVSSIMRGV